MWIPFLCIEKDFANFCKSPSNKITNRNNKLIKRKTHLSLIIRNIFKMADEKSDVGLYGLAVMGQNFALNIASHGFKISVCNRSPSKVL